MGVPKRDTACTLHGAVMLGPSQPRHKGTVPGGDERSLCLAVPSRIPILRTLDAEHLIDLELDGQAVAVPAEAALDVVAGLVRVPTDDVLRPAARAREPGTVGRGWPVSGGHGFGLAAAALMVPASRWP